MNAKDLETLLARDRDMLATISESDADLDIEQSRLVDRASRYLDRDRPFDPQVRAAVKVILDQLTELTAGD